MLIQSAAWLLCLTERSPTLTQAREQVRAVLLSPVPMQIWQRLLEGQGVDLRTYEIVLTKESLAPSVVGVVAPQESWIHECDARLIGALVRDLGGGRCTIEDSVDSRVRVDQLACVGTHVCCGDRLGRVHGPDAARTTEAARQLVNAFVIRDYPPLPESIVCEVMAASPDDSLLFMDSN
ncbi:MAG: hypothetical protein RMN51_01330 [Verrucomicrobiota bacterium]|nr:hypothetical protein [Limisphaera sp.]MDW8380740.1 hypothetical protein [Verrucomicrobiota bacterium]